jgi:hypothetical protein
MGFQGTAAAKWKDDAVLLNDRTWSTMEKDFKQ